MKDKITKLQKEIDKHIVKLDAIEDEEIKAELAKYLCILLSSVIELAFKELILTFMENKTNPKIKKFVGNKIKPITNLTIPKLKAALRSFDEGWEKNFDNLLTNEDDKEKIKADINTIIANRNQIAHGQSVPFTAKQLKECHPSVNKIVELLRKTIK